MSVRYRSFVCTRLIKTTPLVRAIGPLEAGQGHDPGDRCQGRLPLQCKLVLLAVEARVQPHAPHDEVVGCEES
jgi:hypothetical protein